MLEFDHVGVKTGNVTALARGGVGLERIKREVGNCDVVCGNCHRKRTRRRLRQDWTGRGRPVT